MRVFWQSLLCASFLAGVASAAGAGPEAYPPPRGPSAAPWPAAKPGLAGQGVLTAPIPAPKPAGVSSGRPPDRAATPPLTGLAAAADGTGEPAAPVLAAPPVPDPATPPLPGGAPPAPPPPPALLSADEIIYEEDKKLVTAVGHVEIAREGRVVYADRVTYDQTTKIVTATGNVRMFEASGEVIFADYAELTDDLKTGFVEAVRMLMPDSSRMAGVEGERTDGTFMRMNRGVYTACSLCAEDPNSPPLWQLRAARVVHDKEDKEVRYQNTFLEMFGVPVFFTPYFSHPDPTVDRKSGLLPFLGGQSAEFGTFLRSGYYFDIEPETDASLYLTYYASENPLVGLEVRHRFERGEIIFDGSGTRSSAVDRSGVVEDSQTRGHLFADARYELSDAWRTGAELRVASDFNFLREYFRVTGENHLVSTAYAEGFYGRDYVSVEGYRFQSLLTTDDGTDPVVGPMVSYNAFGEPGGLFGGRWSFNSGIRGITRDDGADSTRFTVEPGWQYRYIEPTTGLVAEVNAGIRADLYTFQDFTPSDRPGQLEDGAEGRIVPDAQVLVRYPWVRASEDFELVLEPIAAVSVSPNLDSDLPFPIEDSLDFEFTDANLFARNRFTGTDRIEGGTRLAYGVQMGLFDYANTSVELFLGQSLQFSNIEEYPARSGLNRDRSDYVGHVDIQYAPWFNFYYGFRVDQDSLTPRVQFVQASAGLPALTVAANLTSVDEVTNLEESGTRNEFVTFGASSRLSQYWSASFAHSQSLFPDPGPRSSSLVLSYSDECLIFQTIATRDFTEVTGVETGTSVFFRLIFRNLGEITSPSLSSDFFGGSSTTAE